MLKTLYTFLILLIVASFLNAQDQLTRPGTGESFRNDPIQAVPSEDVIFSDNFNGDNSIAGLNARGWVTLNEDGGGSTAAWFQPSAAPPFPAYEGGTSAYVASNYQGANGFLINHWLISPPITVNAGDTLSFWHRSPDGSVWHDSIYVRYSTTAGTTPASFNVTWGRYKASTEGWARWTGTFNHSGTIRFAIQYYHTDGGGSGTHSNYLGIDYLQVISAGPNTIPDYFLNHNTGTFTASIFNDGFFGDDGTEIAVGVKFGTFPNAMFTAGIMLGNSTFGVSGQVGSFTSGTATLVEDMKNKVPFVPFYSDGYFNQITHATYTDSAAPVPYYLDVKQTSYSRTGDNFMFIVYDITNNTATAKNGIHVGMFADWDVGYSLYVQNRGGMDIPRNMTYQYLFNNPADPNYYGLVALNGMTGGKVTTRFPGDNTTIRFILHEFMSTIQDSAITTSGDYRSYIGSGPYNIAPGQTIKVGFASVIGTNLTDLQTKATAAWNVYHSQIVPVELTSFAASVNAAGQVVLNWTTGSEINNLMFEIERSIGNSEFVRVGYVNGHGTTSEPQSYSYVDASVMTGQYFYRLKQIDYSGAYEYSNVIEVDVKGPLGFNLAQNYPNPFNPSTSIEFSIVEAGLVKLVIYNILGEEIQVLKNEYLQPGFYQANFDATNLPSGMYIYKLESANQVLAKKMMLMK